MKKVMIFVFLLIVVGLIAQTDYEEFMKAEQAKEETFVQKEKQAIANYYSQQDSLFIQYKEKIEKLWGEFDESKPKEWVSYNSDFTGKSKVNFEENKVEVAAVVEKSDSPKEKEKQEKKAKKIVKEQLKAMLKEKDEITDEPLLKDQIKNPLVEKTEKIDEKEIEKVAEKIVEKAKKVVVKTKEGKENVKYVISLEMMPNSVKTRIEKYKPYIEKFCKMYEIEPKYAMAIIHTESYYNPKAYNRHGNAYGMMQIVPRYAGRTMNNYIFKKNKKPSSRQLFNPEINMQMGIGYMRWLADHKWSKIHNETNLYYCIISSYNGGPGTIYKAMTGRMNKIGQKRWDKMIYDLNNWESEKLYKHLRRKIPFAETRKYIKTVRARIEKYYSDI